MRWGVSLPESFLDDVEDAEWAAMECGLQAVTGIESALRIVADSGNAICVASNGSPAAIEHRLRLTGLLHWFDGRVFSARQVARGKPFPDVFLHATTTMGFPPSECVVIEDSKAGIQAGRAAGMRVLAFAAGWGSDAAEARDVIRFADMALLPSLLGLQDRWPSAGCALDYSKRSEGLSSEMPEGQSTMSIRKATEGDADALFGLAVEFGYVLRTRESSVWDRVG